MLCPGTGHARATPSLPSRGLVRAPLQLGLWGSSGVPWREGFSKGQEALSPVCPQGGPQVVLSSTASLGGFWLQGSIAVLGCVSLSGHMAVVQDTSWAQGSKLASDSLGQGTMGILIFDQLVFARCRWMGQEGLLGCVARCQGTGSVVRQHRGCGGRKQGSSLPPCILRCLAAARRVPGPVLEVMCLTHALWEPPVAVRSVAGDGAGLALAEGVVQVKRVEGGAERWCLQQQQGCWQRSRPRGAER